MEDLPVPLSRVELYLAKACGMDVTVPEAPESRLEQYLAILAGDTSVEMPAPMSLTEQWLAYVLGVTPDPLLAVEGACYIDNQKVDVRYFAVAAGMPGAVLPPAPQNRKEQYWANIQGGGGGVLKYATGTIISLTDVVRGITSLENVYGDTTQDGTPTPDAPVAVNVVTGEQNVWVHGKNMFNPALLSQVEGYNTYNSATGLWTTTDLGAYHRSIFYDAVGAAGNRDVSKIVGPLTANTTYTVKFYDFVNNTTTTSRPLIYALFHSDNTIIAGSNVRVESFFTFTTPDEVCYLDIRRLETSGTFSFSKIMIIKGTYTEQTMPNYEAYQGSIFTVSLGSTELCKVGDYQDYIYKSGDDWYVHKDCGKIELDGSNDETWSIDGSGTANFFYAYNSIPNYYFTALNQGFVCSAGIGASIGSSTTENGISITRATQFRVRYGTEMTLENWKSYLSLTPMSVYYRLATPTDTKITDGTLISQLNAVGSAVLPKPNAYIGVSADSTNLPGSLKISYYGEEE